MATIILHDQFISRDWTFRTRCLLVEPRFLLIAYWERWQTLPLSLECYLPHLESTTRCRPISGFHVGKNYRYFKCLRHLLKPGNTAYSTPLPISTYQPVASQEHHCTSIPSAPPTPPPHNITPPPHNLTPLRFTPPPHNLILPHHVYVGLEVITLVGSGHSHKYLDTLGNNQIPDAKTKTLMKLCILLRLTAD